MAPAELWQALGAAHIRHWVYDTRLLLYPEQSCFLALQGQRDGHAYVQEAYARGVRTFLLARPLPLPTDARQVVVPHVLEAMQQLAAWHRQQWQGTLVAITGSNGKTTVKEWLLSLLGAGPEVYASPGSYNSQLGVALALLGLRPEHRLALIECGISQVGEMAHLSRMVQPQGGILTHMGQAHAEGFASFEEKLAQKLLLFQGAEWLLARADDSRTHQVVSAWGDRWLRLGPEALQPEGYSVQQAATPDGWQLVLRRHGTAGPPLILHHPDAPAAENAALAAAAAHHLGTDWATLAQRVPRLEAVPLRLEMITDNPDITLLLDAYTTDADSLTAALARLAADGSQPHKCAIFSDFNPPGPRSRQLQQEVWRWAQQHLPLHRLYLVGPVWADIAQGTVAHCYSHTQALLADIDPHAFSQCTVLVKGARSYTLEQVVPLLTGHPGAAVLHISLAAVRHNLRHLRQHLPATAGLIAMIKAGGYGTGAWQLAQELARAGVAWLGVATLQEALALQRRGITTPIMVQSTPPAQFTLLGHPGVQPVVWSLPQLEALALHTRTHALTLNIHLEWDTGMARLGLLPAELPQVLALLSDHPQLVVSTAFSHLAASEAPAHDGFTQQQIDSFSQVVAALRGVYPALKAHILNTDGVLRHTTAAQAAGLLDLARVGIGLYGVAGSDHALLPAITLSTRVLQVRHRPADITVGYSRSHTLSVPSMLATLAIGYGDGLPRRLGNGAIRFMIRGQWVPTVGRISMDLTVVDVTHIPDAHEGDEAMLIGTQGNLQQTLHDIAQAAGTISYEILTGITGRVRRVYGQD